MIRQLFKDGPREYYFSNYEIQDFVRESIEKGIISKKEIKYYLADSDNEKIPFYLIYERESIEQKRFLSDKEINYLLKKNNYKIKMMELRHLSLEKKNMLIKYFPSFLTGNQIINIMNSNFNSFYFNCDYEKIKLLGDKLEILLKESNNLTRRERNIINYYKEKIIGKIRFYEDMNPDNLKTMTSKEFCEKILKNKGKRLIKEVGRRLNDKNINEEFIFWCLFLPKEGIKNEDMLTLIRMYKDYKLKLITRGNHLELMTISEIIFKGKTVEDIIYLLSIPVEKDKVADIFRKISYHEIKSVPIPFNNFFELSKILENYHGDAHFNQEKTFKKEYEIFQTKSSDNFKYVLIKDFSTLTLWGETLNNCLKDDITYARDIKSKKIMVVGIKKRDRIYGAISVNYEEKYIKEMKTHNNKMLPNIEQEEIILFFENNNITFDIKANNFS